MKRLIISMVLALSVLTVLGAQTEATPEKPETNFEYEPIRKGDQFIRISLGPAFPLFNYGPDGIETDTNLNIGGSGTIGYSRFINSRIALGGELVFAFNSTLGENLYFYLPILFSGTYEYVFNRIHVPLTLAAGFAFQTYNAESYFGPMLKPEAGCWFQYSPEWSFGGTMEWNIIPQWYADSADNRTGNILTTTVGFRYHF